MDLRTLIAGVVLAVAAAVPAHAVSIYTTLLTGAAEAPPNASSAFGVATVMVDPAANTLHVQVTFAGLSSPNTAAHIHCCTAVPGTGTAGVATSVPTFTGFPSGVTSGTYDFSFDLLAASTYNPAFVTAHTDVAGARLFLLTGLNAGDAYLNIHSTLFPGGEIRGFLHSITPVPEPATQALMLAGLALVGVAGGLRRRHR
jgi:hypothetical protein